MFASTACPRCRGTLTRVQDLGDTYHSCVQCGHVVYGSLSRLAVTTEETVREWPQAQDRSTIRRRQIRKAKEKVQATPPARAA